MSEPAPAVPATPTAPTAPSAPELERDEAWQRLDPRMLLVHPVREVLRFLPFVIGILLAGRASAGHAPWQLVGVGAPVLLGVLRYLTTTFRIHAGRVELRRGLLNRHVLSTPVDRVRTVDLTASPIHRVLGLTTIRIGTGTASTRDDDRLDLDGLPVARARELRTELLEVSPIRDEAAPDPAVGSPAAARGEERAVVRFSLDWLRFAPFTSGGLAIAGAILGVASQLGDDLGLWRRLDPDSLASRRDLSPYLVVPAAVVGVLAMVSALAVLGYLLTNWAFTLTRGPTAFRVTRGLLTTRETTLDLDRVAGVVLGEPVGLRLAGGRRLAAVVTGLGEGRQSGALLPPAPRETVLRTAVEVLGSAAPVTGPLVPHGPAAVRRRWVRAVVPPSLVALGAVLAVALGASAWLLLTLAAVPPGALLAADRSRALGHALVDGYVVSRAGSLTRRRSALGIEHVIGWNLRATYWQRRSGLTTLVATTAGGSQRVVITDVPEDVAVALAQRAHPTLLHPFLAKSARKG